MDGLLLNLDFSTTTSTKKQKSGKTWKQQQTAGKSFKRAANEMTRKVETEVKQRESMSSTNAQPLGVRAARDETKEVVIEGYTLTREVGETKEKVEEGMQEKLKAKESKTEEPKTEDVKVPMIVEKQAWVDKPVVQRSIIDAKKRLESRVVKKAPVAKTFTQADSAPVDIDAEKPFISSLFTSNPVAVKVPEQSVQQSRAPLVFSASSTFADIGVDSELCAHLEKEGITLPTNIQRQAVPRLLSPEQDFIIKAQTGSGKTLAFLLPILNSLISLGRNRTDGTFAIVLAPTRELAQQIYAVLEGLVRFRTTKSHWICPGLVIGGDKRKSEKACLRKGVTVLVSTPGRLLDHLKTTQAFNTVNLGWLVLDEADRLLELGFKETLDEILSILDKSIESGMRDLDRVDNWFTRRVTVLCSATISTGVKELASSALLKPLVLSESNTATASVAQSSNDTARNISTSDALVIPENLIQSYIVVPTKLRLISLIGFLLKICKEFTANPDKCVRAMVFISCCDSVEFHHLVLSELKDLLTLPIFKLHGALPQVERSKLIKAFQKESGILVCTDVAARGLDIPFITHSIQYDAPMEDADYVHRIGRTARIGRSGESLMFLMPSETDYVGVLRQRGISIAEMDLSVLLKVFSVPGMSKRDIEANKPVTDVHMQVERFISEDEHAKLSSKKAYASYIKAYATHPQTQHSIFHVRKLHLGHICKSFGMRETAGETGKGRRRDTQDSAEVVMKRKANSMASEEFGTKLGVYKRVKKVRAVDDME